MSFTSDVLLTKTDDELRFYVENPQYYQDELVEAAHRELRRRGASVPAAAGASQPPAPDYAAKNFDEPARPRPALVPALVALGVLALGVGGYRWNSANKAASRAAAAASAAKLSPDSLKLVTVETTSLPDYNLAQLADQQLASIPAAEKEPQAVRQFRELSKRFWAAETQSEYLTNLAYTGKATPLFADQAHLARETWRAWNHAAVYGYKFGPVMQKQYELMAEVASSQQHILDLLPGLLPKQQFRTHKELQARQADVQGWMKSLRPVSPVTGRPYEETVLEINY